MPSVCTSKSPTLCPTPAQVYYSNPAAIHVPRYKAAKLRENGHRFLLRNWPHHVNMYSRSSLRKFSTNTNGNIEAPLPL